MFYMKIYKNKVIELATDALTEIINSENKRRIFYKKRKTEEIANTKLFVDFAMQGKRYSQNNPIRFMMVGRAAGCFDEDENYNAITFIDRNNILINKKAVDLSFNYASNCEMQWVAAKPINEKGERKKQTDKKAFFGFAKTVYLKLTEQIEDEEWYKNIVRTNLFKIIPLSGGNPSYYLRKAQTEKSIEMLIAEIEFYKPTHILIIDGKDQLSWVKDYQIGIKKVAEKTGAKICFVNRPEIRTKDSLLGEIDESFWVHN